MVIDTNVVVAQAKSWLHKLTLIVIGAAAGLSQTVTDKTQDYLEKTKDLPAIVDSIQTPLDEAFSDTLDTGKDVLINTQEKADQIVTKVGEEVVKAGKKVDAVAGKVSKKIQDKLKRVDDLGCKIGSSKDPRCAPPLPEPKPVKRSTGNWQHSPS